MRHVPVLLALLLLLGGCSRQVVKKPILIFGNDGTTWIRPHCPYVELGQVRTDTRRGTDGHIGARGDNRLNYINPLDRVKAEKDPLGYLKEDLREQARKRGGDALIRLVEMKEMGTGRCIAMTAVVIRWTDPDCEEPLLEGIPVQRDVRE